MRAVLRVIATVFAMSLSMSSSQAWTAPELSTLPAPVRAYADALKPYCEVLGKREVAVNRIYSDHLYGDLDINRDGTRDYIIYKCMFGCDGEPYALQGLGPSCMFGSLLLSTGHGHKTVPMPGQISRLETAPRTRAVVYRARIQKEDCGGAWYCNYVFELRDDWFRLVSVCPETGCRALLSRLVSEDKQQSTATKRPD